MGVTHADAVLNEASTGHVPDAPTRAGLSAKRQQAALGLHEASSITTRQLPTDRLAMPGSWWRLGRSRISSNNIERARGTPRRPSRRTPSCHFETRRTHCLQPISCFRRHVLTATFAACRRIQSPIAAVSVSSSISAFAR
jgi:hypothetical protein